jgi:hypothetical protein
MAKEALYFPEEGTPTMVAIIRAGLEELDVPDQVREQLTLWCDETIEHWKDGLTIPLVSPKRKRPAPKQT